MFSIIRNDLALDSVRLEKAVKALGKAYPILEISTIGKSILGTGIPLLQIGSGKKHIVMVGTHHGMEWITSLVLLRFAEDLCESVTKKRKCYRYDMEFCMKTHKILIVPMLNPDGADYQIHGISEKNPLYDRVLHMNGGSTDFSHWQANARGVDLNHNYDCGFTEYKQLEQENRIPDGAPTRYSGMAPESEPETSSLCRLFRADPNVKMVLSLHTQGEEIFDTSGGERAPGSLPIAKKIAEMTGYRLSEAEGLASYGGLTDWVIRELGIPSYTLECGVGENPLPIADFPGIYRKLRVALFCAPMLV